MTPPTPDDQQWSCAMPFWIDTDGYTDRDRAMFVAGVEFEIVRGLLNQGWCGERPIHRENESRMRLMAAKLERRVEITPHEGYEGCETWSSLATTDGVPDDE